MWLILEFCQPGQPQSRSSGIAIGAEVSSIPLQSEGSGLNRVGFDEQGRANHTAVGLCRCRAMARGIRMFQWVVQNIAVPIQRLRMLTYYQGYCQPCLIKARLDHLLLLRLVFHLSAGTYGHP